MFRTFEDFVQLAGQRYCLPIEVAQKIINKKLREKKLNSIDVVCYINWAGIEHLTHKQIATHLGVTQQAVSKRLNRLKGVWPHLWNFGPKIPRFDKRRSDRTSSGGTMGRLRSDVSNTVCKF